MLHTLHPAADGKVITTASKDRVSSCLSLQLGLKFHLPTYQACQDGSGPGRVK